MSRVKGHALRRLAWDEEAKGFYWKCECGERFGVVTVHGARAVWRGHKAQLPSEAPDGVATQ